MARHSVFNAVWFFLFFSEDMLEFVVDDLLLCSSFNDNARLSRCKHDHETASEWLVHRHLSTVPSCRRFSIWPFWLDRIIVYTGYSTLAGDSRFSKLHRGHADPPVYARQGASIYLLNCCIRDSSRHNTPVYTAASTLHCTSSADRKLTSTSSQHLRSAGICCRWSDDVQLSTRWSTRSRSQQPSNSRLKCIFFCPSARLAHWGCLVILWQWLG